MAIQTPTFPVAAQTPSHLPDGLVAAFARANTDTLCQIRHQDLPIADLPASSAGDDCLDGLLDKLIVDSYLDSDLLEQVNLELDAAVALLIPMLGAAAQGVGHGHFVDLCLVQGLLHIVEHVRLNISNNQFHRSTPCAYPLAGREDLESGISFHAVFTDVEPA